MRMMLLFLLFDDNDEKEDVDNGNGYDLFIMEIAVIYLFRSIASFIPIILSLSR
jgi:hypothetical protein